MSQDSIELVQILAPVIVAVAGFYFTRRARVDPIRHLLHERQGALIVRILTAHNGVREGAARLLRPFDDMWTHDKTWHGVRAATNELVALAPEAMAFLPAALYGSFLRLCADATDFLHLAAHQSVPASALDSLRLGQERFAHMARAHIGTDALSEETTLLHRQTTAQLEAPSLPVPVPETV